MTRRGSEVRQRGGEPPREARSEEHGFDFTSPRWREQDRADAEPGRQRRFRNDLAPRQRGSIDAADSVPAKRTERPEAAP